MATTGIPTISAPGIPTDATRPKPWRDVVLKGVANEGVRFLFDLGFPFSYPGGSPVGRPAAGNPAAGAIVQDMSDHENGSFIATGGASGTVYAGGGFDFTATAMTGGTKQGVEAPASVLADIAAPYNGKAQRYLIWAWLKLPLLADWNTNGALLSLIGDRAFNAAPSLISINQGNGGVLSLRRQSAANTGESFLITPTDDYGGVVQVAAWRNDAGQGFRLRSARGTKQVTAALGNDNSEAFGVNAFQFGRPAAFSGSNGGGAPAIVPALKGYRVFRGGIENLARSGRDPVAVLDTDYAAVVARNPFA